MDSNSGLAWAKPLAGRPITSICGPCSFQMVDIGSCGLIECLMGVRLSMAEKRGEQEVAGAAQDWLSTTTVKDFQRLPFGCTLSIVGSTRQPTMAKRKINHLQQSCIEFENWSKRGNKFASNTNLESIRELRQVQLKVPNWRALGNLAL